jgi:membrane associated rhomboid family serine protease
MAEFDQQWRTTTRAKMTAVGRELKAHAAILVTFVALMWFLEVIDILIFRGALNNFGVQPRRLVGLRGILLMPLLHGGLGHLIANTGPFLVLGWLVMVRRTADFIFVTAVVMLTSGLGVWLVGPAHSITIGASGLIFGYFGFLLLRVYFDRHFVSFLLAVVVFLFYGTILWGVLPQLPGVSWQAHLFGFIGGIFAARALGRRAGIAGI